MLCSLRLFKKISSSSCLPLFEVSTESFPYRSLCALESPAKIRPNLFTSAYFITLSIHLGMFLSVQYMLAMITELPFSFP